MNEALHHIRRAILQALNNQILSQGAYVPVHNRVPQDTNPPYIKVYSVSNNEVDQNRSSYNNVCITRVEVVTAFRGDSGGELDCNAITSNVLNLLRKRTADYPDLSSYGFKVYVATIENVTYFEDDLSDQTYFRSIVELSHRVQNI